MNSYYCWNPCCCLAFEHAAREIGEGIVHFSLVLYVDGTSQSLNGELYQFGLCTSQPTLRPESLRNGERHLLSDSKLATFWRRLETRLCSLKAEESMVTITPAMASHIHAMHLKKEISRKLTGDRTKILMLTMPFICRDLAYEEV